MPPSLAAAGEIEFSAEIDRILRLPRRAAATDELVYQLSIALRLNPSDPTCPVCGGTGWLHQHGQWEVDATCGGTGQIWLRLVQAEALRELYEIGGLVAPMRVGSGKTLVTLLAPTVLSAQRPALLLPAGLRNKTRREFALLRRAWRVRLPELISYQGLGQPQQERKLFERAPDLLLCDEARPWLANIEPSVTRRVLRYKAATGCRMAVLSGTLFGGSFLEFQHLVLGALNEHAPVPMQRADAERWALALDQDTGGLQRLGAGALDMFPGGYHAFLRASRGVVSTPGTDCDAAIDVSWWRRQLPPALLDVIKVTTETSMRPDGELLGEFELPDCLCALALGYYLVWDPLPPDWWLRPRRAWHAYEKAIRDEHIEGFDSTSQVAMALDRIAAGKSRGVRPPAWQEGLAARRAWLDVKDRFAPNSVPVWLDETPLRRAVETAERGTLLWVKHRAAGEKLRQLGVPWYPGGTNPESAPYGTTIALSRQAHGTGRNLQFGWSRSLLLHPMGSRSESWEQWMGRTHRMGQRADRVAYQLIDAIPYHRDVVSRALRSTRKDSIASGFSYKLLDAMWVDR